MARLAVTSAVLLLLFAFSYARTTSDLPEYDVIDHHASESHPESHTYPTLLLPSEKTETADQATIAESIAESDPEPTEHHVVSLDALDLDQPPNLVSFRPINRHFGADQESSLRLPRRPCRHGHKGHREIPYGNDMIMSGENSDFDPMVFNGGGLRRMPPRWVRLHHHHHRHHHDHEDGRPGFPFKDHMFKRHFRHEREERDDEREEDGFHFMKRFRKFLHHF